MFARPKNAVEMIPSECVFLCSRCGRKNKSLVLFYDHIFKLEAPHVDRLLERKQAQLERLEAIPLDLLTDGQHRAMQMLDEEIRTVAAAFMMLDQMREAYIDETASMSEQCWAMRLERQTLNDLVSELRYELIKVQKREDFWIELYRSHIKPPVTHHA